MGADGVCPNYPTSRDCFRERWLVKWMLLHNEHLVHHPAAAGVRAWSPAVGEDGDERADAVVLPHPPALEVGQLDVPAVDAFEELLEGRLVGFERAGGGRDGVGR
jgi:hypothetical protein